MRKPFLFALLCMVPRFVLAQIVPGGPSQAQCDTAIANLQAGNRNASWDWIGFCGQPAISPVVQALSSATTETDSTYLRKLWGAASRIRNPDVFSTSLQILSNKSATVPARIMALFVAQSQRDNSVMVGSAMSWTAFVSNPIGTQCPLVSVPHTIYGISEALPTDYVAQLAHITDFISRDNTDNQVLRDWARCVRLRLWEVPDTIDPSLLQLSYVCGRKFLVTNASDRAVLVTYRMSTGETADFAAKAGGATNFHTISTGSVTLFYEGQAIATVENGGTAC